MRDQTHVPCKLKHFFFQLIIATPVNSLQTSSSSVIFEILPDRGLDNEESLKHANGKSDRFTIQKHRTDENNEEWAKIYNESERVQTELVH